MIGLVAGSSTGGNVQNGYWPLPLAGTFCYNSHAQLRGGQNRRDIGLDLSHTPGCRVARDRRHARRGVRQGRVATSAMSSVAAPAAKVDDVRNSV